MLAFKVIYAHTFSIHAQRKPCVESGNDSVHYLALYQCGQSIHTTADADQRIPGNRKNGHQKSSVCSSEHVITRHNRSYFVDTKQELSLAKFTLV
jgi:hypothetical protein